MTIEVYIQDQSHEAVQLPDNAIPGFAVQVMKNKKQVEGMWCRTLKQAEKMAQEYHRQYAIMNAWKNP